MLRRAADKHEQSSISTWTVETTMTSNEIYTRPLSEDELASAQHSDDNLSGCRAVSNRSTPVHDHRIDTDDDKGEAGQSNRAV